MSQSKQKELPSLIHRYELKYTIPMSWIPDIRRFIEPYCVMDKYSQREPDNFYLINNIYLDSPNYLFLNNRLERVENRINMRVRSYGSDSDTPPFFLEIKQKSANVIQKVRCMVPELPKSGRWDLNMAECTSVPKNYLRFVKDVDTHLASPKVRTCYRRMAFLSTIDDYARVTFDIDLCSMEIADYDFSPEIADLAPYDDETLFDPGASVVLELKCYSARVPGWMADVIHHFGLRRRSFSKYVTALFSARGLGMVDPQWRRSYFNLEPRF